MTVTRILSNQHMNSYNTKFILSCLKQTPNSVRTAKKADRAMKTLTAPTTAITMAIRRNSAFANFSFVEILANNRIFHLSINKGGP